MATRQSVSGSPTNVTLGSHSVIALYNVTPGSHRPWSRKALLTPFCELLYGQPVRPGLPLYLPYAIPGGRNDDRSTTSMNTHDPVASVVIPSYNGGEMTRRCLEGLVGQETDFEFEIIVVDSSSDETPSLVSEQFPQVRLTHFGQQTAAPRQRNIGVQQARGQIIAMMDQDCVPDPGWLQGMVDAHREHPDLLVVAGGIRPANPEQLIGLANFCLEFREFNHIRPQQMTGHWITCNVSMKRELFERYGMFPENFWPGDDVVLANRMASSGNSVLFVPELSIAHINRARLSAILPHARKLGWASAVLRRVLPDRENAWLVRHPVLAAFLPVALPMRTLNSFIRWSPTAALKAVPLLPIMSLISIWWGRGFCDGIVEVDLPSLSPSLPDQSAEEGT